MNTAAAINEFATYLAFAAGVPVLAIAILYGGFSPWYKSPLGVAWFGQQLTIVLVFGIILARRIFGEYPGYEWVAIIGYTALTIVGIGLFFVVLIERRNPESTLTFWKENLK